MSIRIPENLLSSLMSRIVALADAAFSWSRGVSGGDVDTGGSSNRLPVCSSSGVDTGSSDACCQV